MVEMLPSGVTLRIRLSGHSAMYRFPAESTAIPCGIGTNALVAGPPSPRSQHRSVPAAVLMMPSGLTFRNRLFKYSEINKLPAESIAKATGPPSRALVAGPPSPENPDVPLPAMVVITPAGDTLRTRELP